MVHLEEMEKEPLLPKSKPSVPQTIIENDFTLNEKARSPFSKYTTDNPWERWCANGIDSRW